MYVRWDLVSDEGVAENGVGGEKEAMEMDMLA